MMVKDLKRKAAKRAAELDADCAPPKSSDEAWDQVEILLDNFSKGNDYENAEQAVMDISIVVARVQNALAWINESGDPEHRRDTV